MGSFGNCYIMSYNTFRLLDEYLFRDIKSDTNVGRSIYRYNIVHAL